MNYTQEAIKRSEKDGNEYHAKIKDTETTGDK